MAIRIVNDGNSVLEIAPSFDECIIESLVEREESPLSFVMDVRDGKPTFKRIRSDDEVIAYISDLYEKDAIGNIECDRENHDVIIHLRQLGQDAIEIEEEEVLSTGSLA